MSGQELIPDQKAVAERLLASVGVERGLDERSVVEIVLAEIGAGRLDPEVARQAGLMIEAEEDPVENNIPGIDMTRVRLHGKGLLALSDREMEIVSAQDRL